MARSSHGPRTRPRSAERPDGHVTSGAKGGEADIAAAESADRSSQAGLGRGAEADLQGVQRRPSDRSGSRVDVLRGVGDLPDADRDRLRAGADRSLGHPATGSEPGVGRARAGADDFQRRDPQHRVASRDRRGGVRRRAGGGAVVGIRLCRGVHAGLQRGVGCAGGTPDLQDAARPPRRDPHHRGPVDSRVRWRSCSPARWPARSAR